MNFETQTYLMKVQTFAIADGPHGLSVGAAPELGRYGEDVSSFRVLEFLARLRLWFAALSGTCFMDIFARHDNVTAHGYQRPPSLVPEAARAAYAPRLLANRQSRRIMARGLPPSRSYAALHHLNARRLTIGQFMERACKLSASNRIVVYRLSGRKRLCQRRDEIAVSNAPQSDRQSHASLSLDLGVCEAHLWPS